MGKSSDFVGILLMLALVSAFLVGCGESTDPVIIEPVDEDSGWSVGEVGVEYAVPKVDGPDGLPYVIGPTSPPPGS